MTHELDLEGIRNLHGHFEHRHNVSFVHHVFRHNGQAPEESIPNLMGQMWNKIVPFVGRTSKLAKIMFVFCFLIEIR